MTDLEDIRKEMEIDMARFRASIRTTLRLQTMLMVGFYVLTVGLVAAFAR